MKIAVCVPAYGDVKADFATSLFGLAVRTAPHAELTRVRGKGTILPEVRNGITLAALEWGADWLFWSDSDQTFEDHTLLSLLARGKPIVGCNYPRRDEPFTPTAVKDGELLWLGQGVEEVDVLGLGVCLIAAEVFRAVPQPWFRYVHHNGKLHGEDTVFFLSARKAGFPAHVDHDLSVGHIGERLLTLRRQNADTIRPEAGDLP